MDDKKTDRRTLRTQKQLKESLAVLLTEKELRHITVQEVSDAADIHRVTFYKHYYDIYDLYEQMEKEVLADLGLMLLRFHENPSKDFARELIRYIAENPKLFRMIFSPHTTGELRSKFFNVIEGIFRLIQTEKNIVDIRDDRLDYLAACWASGCIAVIERWVQRDFAQSQDDIILLLSRLDEHMEKFIAAQLGA